MVIGLIFMEDNKELKILEDIIRVKNLEDFSKEELFTELERNRKLYSGLQNRTAQFINSLRNKEYEGKYEQFFDQYATMFRISDLLFAYQAKLNCEVGRRLGLSLDEIKILGDKVYEETNW